MQLIFVVEANKESQSDYMYIKETLDKFYERNGNKYNPIYAGGKGELAKCSKLIERDKKKYDGETFVFICYDIDTPKKNEAYILNSVIENFAKNNNYELIWFKIDVEDVYLKESVSTSEKTKRAKRFVSKHEIANVNEKDIMSTNKNTKSISNILFVLDKYLSRKK